MKLTHWMFGFGSMAVIVINVIVGIAIASLFPDRLFDFIVVWSAGVLFSAIELGSRYKDDPWSVIASSPGFIYLLTNGLVCCFGLYIIFVFDLTEGKAGLSDMAARTRDVLYASLGSFFVMRSSFLKLGSDNSQLDLGLNLVLKKLLEMIDRQVDRVRANRRSEDITSILDNVSYEDFNKKVYPFCVQIMQNITLEERNHLIYELKAIEARDDAESIKKYAAGLQVYNLVGRSVLKSAVENLSLQEPLRQTTPESIVDPAVKVHNMIIELLKKHPGKK